jgi:predicted ArsR family transcriptional regulator
VIAGSPKSMAVKLALDDKQEILRLYRESDAATTQLAKQFGISTSTVLRLLQELIPAEEYRELVVQKQAKGKRGVRANHDLGNFQVNQLALIPDELQFCPEDSDDNVANFAESIDEEFEQGDETAIAMDEYDELNSELNDRLNSAEVDLNFDSTNTDADIDDLVLELDDEPEDGELEDGELEDGELEDEDLEDDDDSEDDLVDEDNLALDEEDFSEEDSESAMSMFADLHGNHSASDRLEMLPLTEADLPQICYIVVDRIAEIITRPLRDFKDLGAIPPEEALSKTIPIFDNHRVARRFSHHNQRVIKFPSDLIHITSSKLVQKGITRILFSGQVYTLN